MPIVNVKPESRVFDNSITLPEVIKDDNKSLFNELVPVSNIKTLLKYVEGYRWNCYYYGQILNEINTIENFDPTIPNLMQPYYKIYNLELIVTTPLSSSYDGQTAITRISGAALLPHSIKPNVGDIFIAKVDNGEDALFLINTVTRKTYRKETFYEVEYNLFGYRSQMLDTLDSLDKRVQSEYYYKKDLSYENRNSLIAPTIKEANDRLLQFLKESQRFYLDYFAIKEEGSIYLPNTLYKCFDPFLVKFIYKIMDYELLTRSGIKQFSDSGNRYLNQYSIWDVIIEQNHLKLNVMSKTYGFIDTSELMNFHRFGTMFYANIDRVLYPLEQRSNWYTQDADLDFVVYSSDGVFDSRQNTNYFNYNEIIETVQNAQTYQKELFHPLMENNYYIVSENFYEYLNDDSYYPSISYMELLLAKLIKKEIIDKVDVAIAIKNYLAWPSLYQFYWLPISWVLAKYALYF